MKVQKCIIALLWIPALARGNDEYISANNWIAPATMPKIRASSSFADQFYSTWRDLLKGSTVSNTQPFNVAPAAERRGRALVKLSPTQSPRSSTVKSRPQSSPRSSTRSSTRSSSTKKSPVLKPTSSLPPSDCNITFVSSRNMYQKFGILLRMMKCACLYYVLLIYHCCF